MALIQVVKCDALSENELVWKFRTDKLAIGSQLIVNQSQEAVFVKGGEILDIFATGTHTLSTANIPILSKLVNLPFGGQTPFTAEVWFVNRTAKRDLKWGTPSPIQLLDPTLGFPISVRAFGKWGIRVEDSRRFVTQLVGTQIGAESEMVHRFFIGEIVQRLGNALAHAVTTQKLGALAISLATNELSSQIAAAIAEEFGRFGIEVVNFNIESISIPETEMEKIQDVLGKKMEVEQLGQLNVGKGYTTVRTFDTLQAAAENPGQAGGMMAAGVGLGVALPLGQQIGKNLALDSASAASKDDAMPKLRQLKQMFDEGLISEDQYKKKQQELLEAM